MPQVKTKKRVSVPPPSMVETDSLNPHPRNYRSHPEDQLDHLAQSLKDNGFYRPVVIAKDNTILAGHGIVQAAKRLEMNKVPVIQLPIGPDDPKALKVLTGDNAIQHLAAQDDRALTELLKELSDSDDLLGTGYDEMMMAALAMVTRPKSEIETIDAAAEWAGMPDYEPRGVRITLQMNFEDESARDEFVRKHDITCQKKREGAPTWSAWWPEKEREDPGSIKYDVSAQ